MNKEKYKNIDYNPDENTCFELEKLNKYKKNAKNLEIFTNF